MIIYLEKLFCDVFSSMKLLFFSELAKSCLTKADFNFAWQYFEINCYTLHPEWLLLSMLSDPDEVVRKMAVEKIIIYR